jgi:hypothetical protein
VPNVVRAHYSEPPPKSLPVAWKLIVATDGPWLGEIYDTRPGHRRRGFGSVETFCSALLAVTGWSLQLPGAVDDAAPEGRVAGRSPAGGRRLRSGLPHESYLSKGKFIVAADVPWTGEIYRTRPGLRHFRFASFDDFLRAVLEVTGWPFVCAVGQDYAGAGGLSQPG